MCQPLTGTRLGGIFPRGACQFHLEVHPKARHWSYKLCQRWALVYIPQLSGGSTASGGGFPTLAFLPSFSSPI